jgi:hypothetical protein
MNQEIIPEIGTQEQFNLTIMRYRDNEGNPTCAADFQNGRVCIFYGTHTFGCAETCWFADKSGRRSAITKRRNNGVGTLIPISTCPVWHNQ